VKSLFGLFVVGVAVTTQTSGPRWELPKGMEPKAPARDAVVAKVGGKPILASEVEPFLWEWRRKEVVADLVESEVVDAAAKRQGITVNEPEIQAAMDQLLDDLQGSLTPDQPIQRALDERGLGPSRLWLRVRKEVQLRKLILRDVKYDEWFKVSTIVVRTADNSAAELSKALKRAEGIAKRLKAGEAWEAVASAEGGGQIGWRPLSAFPAETQKDFKDAKTKVTAPVQTPNGIQLFHLDSRANGADARAEVDAVVFQARRNRTLEELKKAAGVEIAP
jgi:hypothetical protein